MNIKTVNARQILDSRGNPTVEAEIITENGMRGIASVPSGASTGDHEAMELRDGEMVHFWGKGVLRAVENVEKVIGPAIKGVSVFDQRKVDEKMIEIDGTENKSRLGANAILAVSLACARAATACEGVWLYEYLRKFKVNGQMLNAKGGKFILPVPFINLINGGKHAVDGVDFQEFMIVPHGFGTFSEALESADEVFMRLKEMLHKDGYGTAVGDEGGFAPVFKKNEEALEYLVKAIKEAGFEAGKQISLAVDVAASELYEQKEQNKLYVLQTEARKLTSAEMVDYWRDLMGKYPIVSLEDPLDEDDWEGWKQLSSKFKIKSSKSGTQKILNQVRDDGNSKLQLVGDDLLVTNPKRLQRAIEEQACNTVLIKLNQIGTLTETMNVINLAKENGFQCMISHRSGETEDTFIADLAVGTNCGQIKSGSLSRSERVAKYNRLLRIEERLGEKGIYSKLRL